jgi:hypothetical protein
VPQDALEVRPQPLEGAPGRLVAGVGLEADPDHAQRLERVLQEQQLGFGVDARPLGRGGQPGPADLNGIRPGVRRGTAGPEPRVPVGRDPDGPPIGPADLGERDQLAAFGQFGQGGEVLRHLPRPRDVGEAVPAAVFFRRGGQILTVAGGQRFQPDQGAVEHRNVGQEDHGCSSSIPRGHRSVITFAVIKAAASDAR